MLLIEPIIRGLFEQARDENIVAREEVFFALALDINILFDAALAR
jgi:hypothetical protein